MKKLLIIMLLVTTSIIGACSNENNSVSKSNLPVTNLSGSFSIDVHDINQIVGDADYVFVAKVNEEIETLYKDKVSIETDKGTKEIGDPYTKYSITVINNIKGNLKKSTSIEILKAGGIAEDKQSIVLYEEDELLQVGKYHIIAAYAQPDGSLLVSGPNSSLVLSETSEDKIISTKEYNKYLAASEQQFESKRKHFKSSYEEE